LSSTYYPGIHLDRGEWKGEEGKKGGKKKKEKRKEKKKDAQKLQSHYLAA